MSIAKLAFYNFRKSFHNYFSMILSLAFTVLVLFNFMNLTYAETFRSYGERNKEYIDIIIQVVSVVLVCFMFFFIWYASNVFLTKRKKEIGIYVFMGLTNRKIGKLFLLENVMMGAASLFLGIGAGVVTAQLFQMILLALSEVLVEISFRFVWQPVFLTTLVYVAVYSVFVGKGCVNIVRSSVLEMISAARQNEYVQKSTFWLTVKAVLGLCILANGYYLAIKESGLNVMGNLLGATALVIAGTYFIFSGFLPVLFQSLAGRKRFLYRKERNLWINNVIFRMRKNYRTYAMTCVLLTCSVTALSASFATKSQYDNMVNFRNTYTFQIISNRDGLEEEVTKLLGGEEALAYHARLPFFGIDGSHFSHGYSYGILAFSDVRRLAKETGLDFPYEELKEDEVIHAGHIYLLSLITKSDEKVEIDGRIYRQIDETTVPYLGYMQESQSYYIVNDKTYEQLYADYGQENPAGIYDKIYTYNYRIADGARYGECQEKLQQMTGTTEEGYIGLAAMAPDSDDILWIKVEYSLCIFMFLVFVLAGGSILFMKIYNDAFEEKERYGVLKKIGIPEKKLFLSVAKELLSAYLMPFLFMLLSSFFVVRTLEKMMSADLRAVNALSVLVILVVFTVFYGLSLIFYKKNAGL